MSLADFTPSPGGWFYGGYKALKGLQGLSSPSYVDYSKVSQSTRDFFGSLIVSIATGKPTRVTGSRPGTDPRNLVVNIRGQGGGSAADRPSTALPNPRTVSTAENRAAWDRVLRGIGPTNPAARLLEMIRTGAGKLRKRGRKLRGARGVRWVFQNGRWWQIGRGVLRGGLPGAILTGVLMLPDPTPTGPGPRSRVVYPGGRRGPWRYPDPKTGRYTLPAPAALPGGARPSRAGTGGRVTPRPTPRATGPSTVTAGPGVLRPVVVTSKRVPVPTPSPALPRWVQLVQKAAPLLPLLLPSKSKQPRASATANPVVNFPAPQPLPFPAPLTSFQSPGVGSRTKDCECGPKKPRKPRKPRSVCYRGSYVETATGITKRKREKVPCQQSRKKPR